MKIKKISDEHKKQEKEYKMIKKAIDNDYWTDTRGANEEVRERREEAEEWARNEKQSPEEVQIPEGAIVYDCSGVQGIKELIVACIYQAHSIWTGLKPQAITKALELSSKNNRGSVFIKDGKGGFVVNFKQNPNL